MKQSRLIILPMKIKIVIKEFTSILPTKIFKDDVISSEMFSLHGQSNMHTYK